jgi:serine/threonine protein kinase
MPEKIQNYTVSDRIGTGGTGVVRRGRDTEAKTDVAVKSLNADLVREPQVRKRLKEATKSLQSMPRQENLVRVLDVVESGDTMHVIMEYAPGRSLDNLLSKKSRPMPHESALQLLNGALRGAMAAHSKGFLHGNLKPSDIIITGDNAAKIEGFGIAPLLGNAALVRAAGRTGKIAFMSPEQVRGEGVDERSDVYSLGVILYRMITGKMPFTVSDRDSESRLRQAILQQTTPDITEDMPELNIPPYLANVVKRAIAKDRRERIPTTREFARLLQKVQPEVQQIIASTPSQPASTTGAVLGTAAVAGAATGVVTSAATSLATESSVAPQQSPENKLEQTIAEVQTDTPEQDKPREKSGLSAFFSKTPDPAAPAPDAPTVFTTPTLTKTPMQLEVERRMQAMRAEQAMAEQERLSASPSTNDNEALSTFGSVPNESSSNLPPTPEALSTKLTPTEPIKPAAKNEEKKKRTVLPWLVMGAVALGGGIYYVALKNKGTDGASQPAQRELSKDEQERRYDSLLSKSEKSAEQEQTAAQNNTAATNEKQANADTVANNSPDFANNKSNSNQAAETTAPENTQPTGKSSAPENEKPRIPNSSETPKAATKAPETKGQSSGSQVSSSQASENKMSTSKPTAKKAVTEKTLAENSIAEPTPKKATQLKRTRTSESIAAQENAAPTTTSNAEPRKTRRAAASSESSANKTMAEKRTTEKTPTGSTNSASAKSASAKTTPKSGSLAEANAETIAEREAARERIRQKYADHLKSKEKKPSTLAANTPSTSTEAPAGKSTPEALKDMNKKALPRTNREDNYAPTANPVESPNTVDPSATELANAARKAKGVEPFLILRGHIGNVRSVSFSPDGKTIASGSDDKTVKIWDAATGTILRSLRGHSATVTSVFFSPDGKTLISSGKDKTVRVWDAATGEALQRSPGVSCEGTPAAFSPDGKFLATTDSRNINISKVQR